jgi:hypothetical protein
MTYDEMIAVIQAAKDGKAIEVRQVDRDTWYTYRVTNFDFYSHVYRVKREPREWWWNVYEHYEDEDVFAYVSREAADENSAPSRLECVHVREVIDAKDGDA